MKYKGLALEVANFIDDYKIGKVKTLVKKIKKFYEDLAKKETDKLSEDEKNQTKSRIDNLFNPVRVDNTLQYIEKSLLIIDALVFTPPESDQRTWLKNEFSALKKKCLDAQQKDDYKAQSLKTAITRSTLKSLDKFDGYDENESQIKEVVKRALDQVWLSFNLDAFLNKIKQGLNDEQIRSMDVEKHKWTAELQDISTKYDYTNWLDEKSQDAINVSFATHVVKLTHSSIKGASSVYFNNQDKLPEYLSTSSLKNKPIDVSQTDNKFAPISKFLKLKSGELILADKLLKSDISDLEAFAKDEEQLMQWQKGFLDAFKEKQPASHSLAKQVYYPVGDTYHLISPLFSSSLDQVVFEYINHSKFNQTEIRQQKRNNKYHSEIEISYPNIAILKVTASNHGNASPLNGKRGGRRYLFPTMPPQWKTELNPPINQKDMFYGDFNSRAWRAAKSLHQYLLALQDKKSNKRIRDNVKNSVNDIIDTLFNYVAEIQNMTGHAGWSERATNLKESHQLWLDPFRTDDQFQQARKRADWQAEVCYDFGLWLNHKLRHDKMVFEKLDAKSWANILKKRLREFERDLEVLS